MTKTLMLLTAALFASGSANAQGLVVTAETMPSKSVSYDDLNIGSQAGKVRLAQRIRAAARELCLENVVQPLESALPRRACFQRAVTDGERQMNTAIAARESGAMISAAVLTIRAQ